MTAPTSAEPDGTANPLSNPDLAGVDHWERVWHAATTRRLSRLSYYVRRLDDVFGRHITAGSRFLEVGAGGSRWLPYLARRYGCDVFGIDYSAQGLQVAQTLLRLNGVRGDLRLGDVFADHADLEGQFDVVWSAGFIEHFEDTRKTVRAVARFVAPGGTMITLVPNVEGAVGALHRVADRQVFAMHQAVTPSIMDTAHLSAGLEPVEPAAYFGVFSIGVANFNARRARLPRWVDRVSWGAVLALQQVVCNVCALLRIRPETRAFSPFVVGVYRRPSVVR